jgi:hypothetical protein
LNAKGMPGPISRVGGSRILYRQILPWAPVDCPGVSHVTDPAPGFVRLCPLMNGTRFQ